MKMQVITDCWVQVWLYCRWASTLLLKCSLPWLVAFLDIGCFFGSHKSVWTINEPHLPGLSAVQSHHSVLFHPMPSTWVTKRSDRYLLQEMQSGGWSLIHMVGKGILKIVSLYAAILSILNIFTTSNHINQMLSMCMWMHEMCIQKLLASAI